MKVIIVTVDDDAQEAALDRLARWLMDNDQRFEITRNDERAYEAIKLLRSFDPSRVTLFDARTRF